MSAKTDLTKFFDKARRAVGQAQSIDETRTIAIEAIRLIKVRTRLGYGVEQEFGPRKRLPVLSDSYVAFRRNDPRLSPETSPKRSNLTRTGQLLDSLAIIGLRQGGAAIGPTGGRDDGQTNKEVAEKVFRQGRVFLNISDNELTQLIRFQRRRFGDVLRSQRLTFNRSSKDN